MRKKILIYGLIAASIAKSVIAPAPAVPEFSTYGMIAAVVVIGVVIWYIMKRKK